MWHAADYWAEEAERRVVTVGEGVGRERERSTRSEGKRKDVGGAGAARIQTQRSCSF